MIYVEDDCTPYLLTDNEESLIYLINVLKMVCYYTNVDGDNILKSGFIAINSEMLEDIKPLLEIHGVIYTPYNAEFRLSDLIEKVENGYSVKIYGIDESRVPFVELEDAELSEQAYVAVNEE